MGILKDLLLEMVTTTGAVSANSVAGFRDSLFGGGMVSRKPKKKLKKVTVREEHEEPRDSDEEYDFIFPRKNKEDRKKFDLNRKKRFKKELKEKIHAQEYYLTTRRKEGNLYYDGAGWSKVSTDAKIYDNSPEVVKVLNKLETEFKIPVEVHSFSVEKNPLKEYATPEKEFDPVDVISKLKASEKKSKLNQDTISFALEDEAGEIVKVYIRAEQASDFEAAVQHALAQEDDDENDKNSSIEIAEVLFDLRKKFDIVDVVWPTVEEDEEQEVSVGEEPPESDVDADAGGTENEVSDTEMSTSDDKAATALDAVIDMMKADAEARKADAEARKADAEAKIADSSAKQAEAKVKQEEEILDMETYYSEKKKSENEADRIAQLAKWKHDVKRDEMSDIDVSANIDVNADIDVGDEEEEMHPRYTTPKKISRSELAKLIRRNVAGN